MFYSQPLSTRFGTDLVSHVSGGTWNQLDIAVAWVRESGIRHLAPSLASFLNASGKVRLVVGVDLDNTTAEGLASLLALQVHGSMSVYINHNESGPIFHPKLYLFRNAASSKAKLIIGSNNITEAGLFRNTEAGLEVDCGIDDPLIASAVSAVDAWCDTSLGLALELTPKFLNDLIAAGYVTTEAAARAAAAARTSSSRKAAAKKLFASVVVSPPAKPAGSQVTAVAGAQSVKPAAKASSSKKTTGTKPVQATPAPQITAGPVGQVLLMRVRKAHITDRPTQTQIPKNVASSAFFAGVASLLSVHSGQSHGVQPAMARGIVNTLKLEIPEMRPMNDPIVRFEHTTTGVQYEAYDRTSAQGTAIWASLNAGLIGKPVSTHLTKPASPNSSTWWRFI